MSVRHLKQAPVAKLPPIQHFILVFDRSTGRQVEVRSFGKDSAKAVAKYEELEEEFRDNAAMDIVLVGSDSLDTIKVTHSTYFDGDDAPRIPDVLRIALG